MEEIKKELLQDNHKQDSIQLENTCTFFVVPFYYDGETYIVNEWWEKEDKVLSDDGYNGELLFPYIMDFLQGNAALEQDKNKYTEEQFNRKEIEEKDSLQIYRLKQDDTERGLFWKIFSMSYHTLFIGNKGEKEINFRFFAKEWKRGKQINVWDDFCLPHLLISPTGKLGILVFHVSLENDKNSLIQLKLLNYNLHKLQGQMAKCRCIDIGEVDGEKYRKYLQWHLEKHPIESPKQTWKWNEDCGFTWNMKALVDMFLKTDITISLTWEKDVLPKRNYHLFSSERANLLTYGMISGNTIHQISVDDVIPELSKLARCVDDKYLLPHSEPSVKKTHIKLFENILASTAIEGTAIITVPQTEKDSFIKGYHKNSIRKKYIWIYILAMIQRFTLMNLNRQLTSFEARYGHLDKEDEEKYTKELWELLKVVRDVKVRSYYTDVSSYSHFYEYYQLCCRNLHINETYQEIDSKTKILNLTISHEQAEGEKRKIEKEDREHKWLEVFLAIFAILQGFQIVFEETKIEYKILAIIIAILLGLLAPSIIKKWTTYKSNK